MGTKISIKATDGSGTMGAYLAKPAGDAKAGIVILQEIFGVSDAIRATADAWAAQGYVTLAPDLFWRLQPGVELNPDVPAEFQQGLDLMGRFDIDKSIEDITASIAALRAQNCRKVGAMGHCLGGKLAFLTAARTDSDATAAYYAVGLDDMLGEAASIKKPFLIHIAARDRFVPPESQAKIHAALQGKPNVEVYDYDADHAFARHHGASRVPALADIADKRTREFFAKHLR